MSYPIKRLYSNLISLSGKEFLRREEHVGRLVVIEGVIGIVGHLGDSVLDVTVVAAVRIRGNHLMITEVRQYSVSLLP